MARVDPDFFGEKEVARVYIAARVREARRVEETLTGSGIEYCVEIESFRTYILGLFPSEQAGVAFYVIAGQADYCRRLLLQSGLRAGLVDESPA